MSLSKPTLTPAMQRLTSRVKERAADVKERVRHTLHSSSERFSADEVEDYDSYRSYSSPPIREQHAGGVPISPSFGGAQRAGAGAISSSYRRGEQLGGGDTSEGGTETDGDDSRSDVTDPYVEEVENEAWGNRPGIAVRKIHVAVCAARNLMAKGADDSSDPFCILEFDGKQKRTTTKVDSLNPLWDEEFVFTIPHASTLPGSAAAKQETLEISIYSRSRTKKHHGFLGRVRFPINFYGESEGILPRGQEKLIYYPLEKRSLLSRVKGEIGLKLWYDDTPRSEDYDSDASIEGPRSPGDDESDFDGGSVAVYAKDNRRGGIHQQGNVAHVVTGVSSPFDLVDQVEYLFVRVLRARALLAADSNGTSDPYVKIHVGPRSAQTRVIKHELNPEWNEVFAFNKAPGSGSDQNHIDRETGVLELSVWDEDFLTADDFLGQIQIPLHSVPMRVYPEKGVDPQWFKLERRSLKDAVKGDIMVAVWFGTQSDEAFASAWQSDTGGLPQFRSRSYATPRMWYLRVTVIEAQNLTATDAGGSDPFVKVKLGSTQEARTKPQASTLNPVWKEDLFFVVAEPFEDSLLLTVADFNPYSANDFLGQIRIPLGSIETRLTNREVGSRWYALDKGDNRRAVSGRLHLRLVFEGGYHINDGSVTHNSDSRPTAKQLWRPPIATLELGIIGAAGLPIMKTNSATGGGTTDAYVVAKHGKKWVRTRTVKDESAPLWNEQYTWDVHEPSTVLTIGVFDNQHTRHTALEKARNNKDKPLGKMRIRLSTLEGNKVYRGSFPLFLHKKRITPMGTLDLAIRFTYPSSLPILRQYLRPVLPAMHYLDPIGKDAAETLRISAMNLVADRLAKYDPPLRREVVEYMLDTDEMLFTMRRIRANWNRIKAVFSGVPWALQQFNRVCQWRSPPLTLTVHGVFIFMVLRPHFILPTVLAMLVGRGAFYFQHRPRGPASMDPRLSGGEEPEDDVDDEEDEEELMKGKDKTSIKVIQNPYRNYKIIKARFDKMKGYAALVQNILGQIAAQGERLTALLEWRDPRASTAFCSFCAIMAVFLFFAPIRYVAILVGCFIMRHPRFRNPLPPAPVNLFLRLPSLEDRII
ncbi:synaptotagmin family protein [Klebsormidium nitens]|uniref:Synaptotagmin family protein n=1 Tax=Klebsormidium nitens TaxID=105231 RepID=A0A1Y1I052_KLENI|nr:synaptotagmin family protein [Klebsormidium nitens]|eukprot:GAQ82809.1 synaptotagmin family protein [Klebsormidium nitens]